MKIKTIEIKISFKNEKKTLKIDQNYKYSCFKKKISNNFKDLPSNFDIKYLDEENEYITCDSEEEWIIFLEFTKEFDKKETNIIIFEAKAPRISLPFERMKSHYEYIVVGSGYGGGIAASRLCRAKKQVCLFERKNIS
jgi:hypothetical protein